MNINPTNIAGTFEYNRNNHVWSNAPSKKNSYGISIDITEKFEPGENNSSSINVAKIQLQYSPAAPVVKTNTVSKKIFETIHYKDVLKKETDESLLIEKQVLENVDLKPAVESVKEISKGFYLTVPQNDLKRPGESAKKNQNKLEEYNSGKKSKKGVLVNLTV